MSSREALNIAQEADLDLVKIVPTANPPVCKIINYGKYRYEQGRREKEAKKKMCIRDSGGCDRTGAAPSDAKGGEDHSDPSEVD